MEKILSFEGIRKQKILNSNDIGGKASGLLWLEQHGYKTPAWCVFPVATINEMLNPVQAELSKILSETRRENLESNVRKIENVITELHVPLKAMKELDGWIKDNDLGDSFFAVRSSFVGEDSASHSFAGQLKTLLKVSQRDIADSIIECVKASFSKMVLGYKLQNSLPLAEHSMSVVVQKMIFAQKSGVCFSINPNTLNSDEMYISATFGDCEGVVSGESDCDTYVISKSSGEINKTINEKKVYSSLETNEKTKLVKQECANISVLSTDDLGTIKRAIEDIEKSKNHPLDVEWAFDGGLQFLQVRPVTVSKFKKQTETHSIVYDNSNIQESYCGITLPLTFSFASECYRLAYNQLMSFMGFSDQEISENDFRHSNMLSFVDGRVYYNIHSWYQGLKMMPSFGRSKGDMEAMMGVEEPVDFVQNIELSFKEKMRRVPALLSVIYRLTTKFAMIDKIADRFEKNFWSLYKAFASEIISIGKSPKELIMLKRSVTDEFLSNWAAPLVNDFYVMVYNGKVSKTLKSINKLEELSVLTSGEEIESIKPTLEIIRIADFIKSKKLDYCFVEISNKSLTFIAKENIELHLMIQSFIDTYGDRCMGELKLETKTYKTDQVKLLNLIKNYLTLDSIPSIAKTSEERLLIQQKLVADVRKQSGFLKSMAFRSHIKKLRKGIVHRERMRMHRTRVVGLFRSIYTKLGESFYALGVLDAAEDIFYLSHLEIENFVFGKALTKNFKSLVNLRKEEFSAFAEKEPKHHFKASFPFPQNYVYYSNEKSSFEESESGLGCYPGVVEAPVECMLTPDETVNLKGKILCTVRTDPGWASLFPQVSALLIEKGSSLSHSAVIAREMGIPTVVGVKDITKKLVSGDVVRLDGKTGAVNLIRKYEIENKENK